MKTYVILLFALAATASAQGPLTPPTGAPAPVMKSLDQVEARTPLVEGQPGVSIQANGTIVITQPGSYYLTKNLTITTAGANGIAIGSSNVTLDLNGFSLICTEVNGGDAIFCGNHKAIHIENGVIVGGTTQSAGTFSPAGWGNGTTSIQPAGGPVRVSDLIVRGVRNRGLSLGFANGSVAERCTVDTCAEIGIVAHTVRDCVVLAAGSDGIWTGSAPNGGVVSNCHAESVGPSGQGISAGGAIVTNSKGSSVNGFGIFARLATSCIGHRPDGVAIQATTVNGCIATAGTITATNKYNTP